MKFPELEIDRYHQRSVKFPELKIGKGNSLGKDLKRNPLQRDIRKKTCRNYTPALSVTANNWQQPVWLSTGGWTKELFRKYCSEKMNQLENHVTINVEKHKTY